MYTSTTEVGFTVSTNSFQAWTEHNFELSLQTSASGLLSDEVFAKISLALISLIQAFNITGVVSNILSIAVFTRLGFSEPSTISLLALAVCDLLATVLSLWSSLSITPSFRDSGLPFDSTNIALLTGAGLWTFVVRCVAWIIAFISVERCLCILIPLRVKRLITPKTTFTAVLIIAALTVGPSIGIYWRWNFVWIFNAQLNESILNVAPVNTPGMVLMEEIVNIGVGVVQPLVAFGIVLVCTIFLIVHLRRSSAWRKSVSSAQQQGAHNSESTHGDSSKETSTGGAATKTRISNKEERVVKMVTIIAAIFIACFTPSSVMILSATVFSEFSTFGRYRNVYLVMFLISSLGESISASANIIIYYIMASKYRLGLRRLLGLDRQEKKA